MKCSRGRPARFILLIAALIIAFSACSQSETTTTQTATTQTATAADAPQPAEATRPGTAKIERVAEMPVPEIKEAEKVEAPAPDLTPPQPDEVRRAVARVYEKAVRIDEQNVRRAIVGDFNGDGSSDIAVVVRPSATMLGEINSEVANWIIEDPRRIVTLDPTKLRQPIPASEERVKIEEDDTLLAIIHGHQQKGWRNTEATQSYLLKNAVGGEMKPQSSKEAKETIPRGKRPPALQGDVINATLGVQKGMLYWTGAKYGWYH